MEGDLSAYHTEVGLMRGMESCLRIAGSNFDVDWGGWQGAPLCGSRMKMLVLLQFSTVSEGCPSSSSRCPVRMLVSPRADKRRLHFMTSVISHASLLHCFTVGTVLWCSSWIFSQDHTSF